MPVWYSPASWTRTLVSKTWVPGGRRSMKKWLAVSRVTS